MNSHIFQVTISLLYQERNSMEHPPINLANLKIPCNLQSFFIEMDGNGTYPYIPSHISRCMQNMNNSNSPLVLICLEIMNPSWPGLLEQVSKSPEARDVDWCSHIMGFCWWRHERQHQLPEFSVFQHTLQGVLGGQSVEKLGFQPLCICFQL